MGGARYLVLNQPHLSSVAHFSIPIPRVLSLCGMRLHAQGACTGGPGPQLSNALDFVIGF